MTGDVVAGRAAGSLAGAARGLVAGLAGAPGRRRALVGYAAYTAALFLVCLIATFPHDLVLQRALTAATARSPVRIETGRGSVGWSLAYALDSLRVRAAGGDGEPMLAAEALRISPSRLGLLRGNPYPVGIDATLYGGTLRGTIDPRPGSFAVDATLAGVDLGRYTGLRPWVDGTIRGRLEGAVALDAGGRGLPTATGTVQLRITDLTIEGTKVRGITVPDLHFSDVHLNGSVKSGRLEIGELGGDGREIGLRGEGNVLLREPLDASPLSLDLTLTPAAGADDGLKLAVNMLPGAKGDGGAKRLTIVGTLGRPSLR